MSEQPTPSSRQEEAQIRLAARRAAQAKKWLQQPVYTKEYQ